MLSRDDEKMAGAELKSTERYAPRRVCGMRLRSVWILVVVLVIIAIAVGVGAGVGATKDHHSASATTTSPSTANVTASDNSSFTRSSSAPTSTISDPADQCKNGTTYISSNNTPFKQVCNTDFNVGKKYNTTAADLDALSDLNTFSGCMEACAVDRSQEIQFSRADGQCQAVTWVSDYSGFGTCYIKNATALVGSSNKTEMMEHSFPRADNTLQSANIVGDDGQPL